MAEQGFQRGAAVPPAAMRLGYAGLIPFVGLALASVAAPNPWRIEAEVALIVYGAAILSFMGGCRWGFAAAEMGDGPTTGNLAVSVLPALNGWLAALLGGWLGLMLLALAFLCLLAADLALTNRGGAPAWWPNLRWPLTLGAVVSLLTSALV
ncbi:MAG: DUF3429 domain-containing protein [Pseudomonadota bacterium]